jgi:hypothetical protein
MVVSLAVHEFFIYYFKSNFHFFLVGLIADIFSVGIFLLSEVMKHIKKPDPTPNNIWKRFNACQTGVISFFQFSSIFLLAIACFKKSLAFVPIEIAGYIFWLSLGLLLGFLLCGYELRDIRKMDYNREDKTIFRKFNFHQICICGFFYSAYYLLE